MLQSDWLRCNLIGYATRYPFVNRYRVAASKAKFFAKKR